MAPLLLALVIAAAIGFGAAWVVLVHRRTTRFAHLALVHGVAEKILATTAEAELAALLQAEAGRVFGAADVLLYRYRRHRRILEPLRAGFSPIELPDPSGLVTSGWAGPDGPLLLPIRANGQLLGALELRDAASSGWHAGLIQHLCVIVAAALQAQEQQQVREHLRRTEQLAMAGQISAAIVTELREPIREIQVRAEALLERPADSATMQEIRRVVRHASETAAILERLVGFSRTDRNEITTVELNALLRGLVQLRDATHRTRGFEVRPAWSRDPVYVEGVRSQLEEALLQLLFHAEQVSRSVELSTRETGGMALLRFEFTNPETQAELPLCRSLLRAHGGELAVSDEGFVVELPTVAAPVVRPPVPPSPGRELQPMTILVIEPEETSQRRLLTGLGEAGHRVVPVTSAEEGIDLLRRIPFDAVFCSTRLSGMKWLDFFETARSQLRAFVLVVEDFDGSPRGDGIRVLRRHWEPAELLAALAEATQALPVA
jgi:signal transduction histidine kinase/CheY-like chemotaxis protein